MNVQSVRLIITRGGVTGELVADVEGAGRTVCEAVRDAFTAPPAKFVRKGDFISLRLPVWLEEASQRD